MTSKAEFYIFRDSRRRVSVASLADALRAELRAVPEQVGLDAACSVLLRAGELECGLLDAAAPEGVSCAACSLTSELAAAALACDAAEGSSGGLDIARMLDLLDRMTYSEEVNVGVPEGFAYYAIHPLDYADLIERVGTNAPSAVVIGIRSIGTTLSAVVAAKLRELGTEAHRFTVRPSGHPYDRVCRFSAQQRQTIASGIVAGVEFVICDEGPGRSGSSLLSVAEALESLGVPRSRILILCSYEPDVSTLCARDAERRWRRYRSEAAGATRRLPRDARECLGGGEWRGKYSIAVAHSSTFWPQMEPLAYGSADGRSLLIFEGHGPYGEQVRRRSRALADAGYAPEHFGQESGFGRHALVQGSAMQRHDLTPQLLHHMAEYCAWRAREFHVDHVNASALETMARVNFERQFGTPVTGLLLQVERPAICDTRMMPGAWLRIADEQWMKLDAGMHGDDHFFPGPCDIAWDLAGIVVEWDLSDSQRECLLECYQRTGGEDASSRIASYELAYAIFRMAWSATAAASAGEAESKLTNDYRRYRRDVLKRLPGADAPGLRCDRRCAAQVSGPSIST